MPDYEAIDASWRLVIGELEADIARLNSGDLAGTRIGSADWSAPAMAGPLPDEYAQHVRGLIEAQREAIERLEEERRIAGEHIVAVRAAEKTREHSRSVYLDVEG